MSGQPSGDYDALASALREMPDQMARAWGGDRSWLTSGTHVAELVREWLTETIEEARVIPPADEGLRFRVETACDGYAALWESDVPDDVASSEDYLRGAHDAAEAIRACVLPPAESGEAP